jgi:hypothetical protein
LRGAWCFVVLVFGLLVSLLCLIMVCSCSPRATMLPLILLCYIVKNDKERNVVILVSFILSN